MVPNIDGTIRHTIKTRKHPRHRTHWVIQYPTNRNPAQSLQENAITVFGPRLYNSLPKYLRDIKSVKLKNSNLSSTSFSTPFLISQKCSTMSPHHEAIASSTSPLIWGLKEFTTMVESPTRPWSSLSCFEATPSIQVSKYPSNAWKTVRCESVARRWRNIWPFFGGSSAEISGWMKECLEDGGCERSLEGEWTQ